MNHAIPVPTGNLKAKATPSDIQGIPSEDIDGLLGQEAAPPASHFIRKPKVDPVAAENQIKSRPSRNIACRYKPEQVGEATLALIYRRWKNEVPLDKILQAANNLCRETGFLDGEAKLGLVDLYAILANGMKEPQVIDLGKKAEVIRQRRKPSNEMTVHQFCDFLRVWRYGGTFEQCKTAVLPFANTYYCKKCFTSIMERYRGEKRDRQRAAAQEAYTLSATEFERTILRYATRRRIDGEACIVIPLRQMPVKLLDFIKKLPEGKSLILAPPSHREQQEHLHDLATLNQIFPPSIPLPDATIEEIQKWSADPSSIPPAPPEVPIGNTDADSISKPREEPEGIDDMLDIEELGLGELVVPDSPPVEGEEPETADPFADNDPDNDSGNLSDAS